MAVITKKDLPPGLCYGCHRTVKNRCPRCKRCKKCECRCFFCRECQKYHRYQTICNNCGDCKKICQCGHKPGYSKDFVWANSTKTTSALLNPFKRAVSVEIELTYYGDPPVYGRKFNHVRTIYTEHDGSVDGTGREMIIPGLIGDSMVMALTEVGANMVEAECTVNKSCGYHVHVDARDWKPLQVFSLLALWEKFAKNIGYPYLFPTRKNNTMCKICYEQEEWYKVLLAARNGAAQCNDFKAALTYGLWGIKKPTSAARKETHQEYFNRIMSCSKAKRGVVNREFTQLNTRYMDLNLHSFFHRGTIEFRSHHGTTDAVEMIGWALTCLNLMHIAERHSYTQIESMTLQDITARLIQPVQQYIASKGYTF